MCAPQETGGFNSSAFAQSNTIIAPKLRTLITVSVPYECSLKPTPNDKQDTKLYNARIVCICL